MSTNKHATIRYHALDRCFSNFGRRYYIEDLIDACSKAIYEYTGIQNGVKRRQIFDDMCFMESEQGWSVPLVRHRDGKRVFYRYEDPGFTIEKKPITTQELETVKDVLLMLNRFRGIPDFKWIDELNARIDSIWDINQSYPSIISFEENPYLRGIEFFSGVFNALKYNRVLEITYKGFRQEEPESFRFHPYYLKQYNSRWFLFGLNDKQGAISNLAIDRILSLEEKSDHFIPNSEIDFDEFFDDVIGVTIPQNTEPEKILLNVSSALWPYVDNKPLHGSQKIVAKNDDGSVSIELFLIVNYEFISQIFSYSNELLVLKPDHLVIRIKNKIDSMLEQYKEVCK